MASHPNKNKTQSPSYSLETLQGLGPAASLFSFPPTPAGAL